MTEPPTRATPRVRHLTATGFVVWQRRVLLHWHRKNAMWLPFGGHIEANEDPLQCVVREIAEECGIAIEVFGSPPVYDFAAPRQLPPPVTILLERVTDGISEHEHIDLIYFCRPATGPPPTTFTDSSIRWVDRDELFANEPMAPPDMGEAAVLPADVRALALAALQWERTETDSGLP